MASPRMAPKPSVWKQKVLVVGRRSDDPLANTFRNRGMFVEVSEDSARALQMWRPKEYDFIFLDVRSQLPGEVIDFCERVKRRWPQQKIAFLTGPPLHVSLDWPIDAAETHSPDQWEETVRWFMTAA